MLKSIDIQLHSSIQDIYIYIERERERERERELYQYRRDFIVHTAQYEIDKFF